MRLANLKLNGRIVAAPLAGISNRPFRLLARQSGAALVFTEMVSSQGLIRTQAKSWALADFGSDERPIGVQIFGADPPVMAKAAAMLVERIRPDVIDVNFGCPARKVVRQNGGAAVLKDLVLTEEIIRAAVEGAGGTPVTVKMRTGWDDTSHVFEDVGRIAQRSGAAAVTLHARSRSRGFAGQADWSAITRLKECLAIPVIGNGDVRSPEDVRRMLDETGCEFVMIGRAALADPSIFKQANQYLATGVLPVPTSVEERINLAVRHVRLMVEQFGQPRGIVKMRRQLGWYVRGFRGAAQLRARLFTVESLADIKRIFSKYIQSRELSLPSDILDGVR